MDTCVQIENEFWLPVPGYVGWVDASTAGRVRRWYVPGSGRRKPAMLDEPVVVQPFKADRYLAVSVRNAGGASVVMSVHWAVLFAWIGPRPRNSVACHFPSADSRDNELSNLRWASFQQNSADEVAHKRNSLAVVQERLDKLRTTHRHLRESAIGCWFSRESPLRSAP